MIKFILFALAAIASAQDTNNWCIECENLVESFDIIDATTLADEICPLFDSTGICEDIAPYMIDWIQEHVYADTVCEALCDEKFDMLDEYPIITTSNDWCDDCKDIIDTFDGYDIIVLTDEICPFLQYNGMCEGIAPYVFEWIQQNITYDMICSDVCAAGEDYDTYGDYNDDVAQDHRHHPETPHVAQDLHHHPFDLPHPETPHVAQDLHHHPFDLPHPEPPKDHRHHHLFDLPHSPDTPLVEPNVTEEE